MSSKNKYYQGKPENILGLKCNVDIKGKNKEGYIIGYSQNGKFEVKICETGNVIYTKYIYNF